jgi:NADH-quinone oxidoreductase subunit N
VAGPGEARLDLDAYAGLGWTRPAIGVAMTIFLLSLAGFPFTAGFIGKVFLLRAAVERDLVLLAVVLVLASLVSYWYYLRVAWYMWFREAPEGRPSPEVTAGMRWALAGAAFIIVALGLFPGSLIEIAERSAATLFRVPGATVGVLFHP